ncbi:hypothetical protein C0989_012693 [Termitomyces sp. Mn162]|nr:hypothetical protein C0989_012693 [Termitomyces sp. Mn162]
MFTHFYAGYESSQPAGPATFSQNDSQAHGTDLIGRPILFVHGQFAGSTIRAELREIQQAELGRKYARVDRRPLDPPPVVQLRLFKVYSNLFQEKIKLKVASFNRDVQILGLLCTVDLFPVPFVSKSPSKSEGKRRMQSKAPNRPSHIPSATPSSCLSLDKQQPLALASPDSYHPNRSFDEPLLSSPTLSTSSSLSEYGPQLHTIPNPASETVHYVNNHPIEESSKATSALVGATFVQPSVIDYEGKKAILFVFADLAVKIEGSFILRYRFFDIFSRPYNYQDLAIQAECYGGAFHVYSTKEFPGLQASTELTKHLARWGVRLNTRETERRRRKKGETREHFSPSPNSGTRKRKRSSGPSTDGGFQSDEEE